MGEASLSNRTGRILASQIEGTLPVSKGGTGSTNIDSLVSSMTDKGLSKMVCGTYTGDSVKGRIIDLGFTPKAVFIITSNGMLKTSNYNYYGGLALQGYYCGTYSSVEYADASTHWSDYSVFRIVSNGFELNYRMGGSGNDSVLVNSSSNLYYYLAFA